MPIIGCALLCANVILGVPGTAKGAVTTMVEKLLARCVVESRPEVRLQLATCLGEMGALCETKLGELKVGTSMGEGGIDSPSSSYTWRLEQAPWNSISVLYQLELVRKHLAVALNAASSSTDQNKIAFSIQQLLKLLDNYGCRKESSNKSNPGPNQAIKSMSAWLKEKLEKNGVFDAVEPYFLSEFKEKVSVSCLLLFFTSYSLTSRSSAGFRRIRHKETSIFRYFGNLFHLDFEPMPLDDRELDGIRQQSLERSVFSLQNRRSFRVGYGRCRIHTSASCARSPLFRDFRTPCSHTERVSGCAKERFSNRDGINGN